MTTTFQRVSALACLIALGSCSTAPEITHDDATIGGVIYEHAAIAPKRLNDGAPFETVGPQIAAALEGRTAGTAADGPPLFALAIYEQDSDGDLRVRIQLTDATTMAPLPEQETMIAPPDARASDDPEVYAQAVADALWSQVYAPLGVRFSPLTAAEADRLHPVARTTWEERRGANGDALNAKLARLGVLRAMRPSRAKSAKAAAHVASYRSQEKAAAEIAKLSALFGGRHAFTDQRAIVGGDVYWRIVAPAASRDAARALCEELKREVAYCAVIPVS